MRKLCCCLPVLALLWSGAALADAALDYRDHSGGADSPSRNFQLLIGPKAARMNSAEGWMLFDAETRHLFIVKDAERSFTEIDPEKLEAMSKGIGALSEQARAMLDMLPPDQRAQAEKYLTPKKPVPVRYHEIGGERTVAGYRCRSGEILQANRKLAALCVADAGEIGLSQQDRKVLDALYAVLTKLQSTASQYAATPMPNLAEIDGVPVEAVDLRHGRMQQLAKVSTKELAPELFVIPGGYSRKPLTLPPAAADGN